MLSCENKKKYWLKNIDKTEDFLFVFSFSLQVRTDQSFDRRTCKHLLEYCGFVG